VRGQIVRVLIFHRLKKATSRQAYVLQTSRSEIKKMEIIHMFQLKMYCPKHIQESKQITCTVEIKTEHRQNYPKKELVLGRI
jgi:hypothetical protein